MSKKAIFNFMECDKKIYNVNCKFLDFSNAPVNGMICHLLPGEKSEIHNHYEVEVFLFLSGSGIIYLEDHEFEVKKGVGVKVSEFKNHIIYNNNEKEALVFMSVYWENSIESSIDCEKIISNNQTLIFSTPPTPNGDLHLGHLSGPYIAADIYKRYLKHTGKISFHVTGRDDHQTYVATKSKILKLAPHDTANYFSELIKKTLEVYNVDLDYFIEPSNIDYQKFVNSKVQELFDKGIIYSKIEPAIYDKVSNRYLHEGYIRGNCPYCYQPSDGNACEACGKPNVCIDLLEIKDLDTEKRECERLFFKLNNFKDKLYNYIKSSDIPAHSKVLALNLINQGLEDICISHPSSWGLNCTIKPFRNQIIYVWFEMAFGYLWAASKTAPTFIENTDKKVRWFYDNTNNSIVHFYGFDNSFYHTILFPAVYMAFEFKNLPKIHIVNELLNLEGIKFSTSRNHLIYGQELLNDFPADHVRWYLCKIRPEGVRTNFTLNDAKEKIDHFFNQVFFCWKKSLCEILEKYFENQIPEPGEWTSEHQSYFKDIKLFLDVAHNCYQQNSFSLVRLTQEIELFAIKSESFLKSQQYYFNLKDTFNYSRTVIALSSLALKTLAEVMLPITPKISRSVLDKIFQNNDIINSEVNFFQAKIYDII